MTESSRRFRNSTSRGIAASSAIALALGGFSVVGPGPLTPHAAAATLSGGVREKSGAVETDAQQASDLPAGSCVVKSGEPSGNQAGFRWNTLEPSGSSPDKTLWGLSVSFDNSKDRTFADWYFTNTGGLGTVLNTGTVPPMEAGQTFDGKSVTHKADESIDITTSGRGVLRNLNLYAELTDEKVNEFASASAADPLRYAWQSNYKVQNPNGPYATKGSDAFFGATVNPWPSENIECNPITVSWETAEVSEKHVIVPGEETKVGTIKIPAVQNGGKDDSMSRMVVEAYDGNGKFIGTTDPEASGGEQLLRIDEANGDIFFTWPEYRGTDLATDKNVNFSVLAKPRTVAQLQSAAENNNEGVGKTFDSSNSLTRYNKANVIDSTSFSLDDTEYHDPKYDKTDAVIISGVDSATGPLATELQKVTFTQVPDKIAELVKKRDAGGFEAEVTLDEKYVYEGWTVEFDDNYNVTVTAPENPKPGTFARPVITVEYSNGSTDRLELFVVVDPNNTQVTDLVRPGLTTGTIGGELTAQVGTKSIMKGHKPVHPAKFEVDPSTVPDGWTVTVDDTGKVTAKADDTVAPGTIITPKVKATYPDQTTDEIETQFQAIVDIKIPTYDTVTNKPNSDVTLKPEVPARGLSGNTTDEAPKRYTFEDGTTTLTHTDASGTWTLNIDETTGVITTTIPKTAPEGYVLDVPVLAYYNNAKKPQKVKGTVVVLRGDIAPVYSVESTGPNKAVNHQVQGAPEGSKFSLNLEPNEDGELVTEDGWKYTIDPDTGVVTSTPPAGSKPGDKKTITVDVVTPSGATPKVPVTTVVQLTNSWEAEPSYPAETVYPGETATLPVTLQKPANVNVAKYELGAVPQGWTVSIDNDGKVTATAPADAVPGSKVEIPVTVTYEDGSTDTATAVVNVVDVPTRPVPFGVEYVYDDTIPAGEYKTVTKGVAGVEKQQPDGTWEQTTAPTNEVVHVGTKPAEASKDVTWTAPIPYSTTTRSNPALAPGETKVVQQGVNGERTYTAKFTATGAQASVVESEDTKQPVEEIIEYGPRLDDQELVTETTRKIPFETTIVYDNTLAAGTQVVDKQGEVGEETVTSTQKLVDGKPSGDPVVATETTKPKQDAVIRVGTKTEGANSYEYTEPVPYPTKVEYDPNVPAGTYEVVTPGEAGEKTVTVTQTIVNSQVTDTKREENVTTQPVTEVIKVGTKQATATDKVEWTEPIPFSTVVRPNPDLKPGEVKTVQEGVNGEAKYTATFEGTNGQATVTESKGRTEPTDRIIEYGPTIPDQTLTSTTTNPVPFNTTFVADPNLPVGEQVVDKQGENGVDTITSTQEIKDGKPVGEPTITTQRTKEPVDAVVRVGTKTTGQTVNSVEAVIPFEVEVVYDPNLAPGEQKVIQEGELGTKKVTVTQPVVNSQPNGQATTTEETVKEPTKKIIAVGTKPAEATNTVTWTVDVPFKTVVRANPDLKPGEVKTVQEGEYGEKKFTADFSSVGSDSKVDTKEEQTKAPKDLIIEYGPTIGDQTLKTETTRPIEFKTEFIYDDTLPAGEQKIDQQGENGEEKITSTQEIKDGKPVGEPTITTQRTKEPVNAVVRVGTKTEGSNTFEHKEPVPYETKIEYDPTLAAGEYKVETPGKAGEKTVTVKQTIVNSQVTDTKREENVTTQPVTQVIKVGTKQPAAGEQVTWTEPIPFTTEFRENPALKPGETKVVQEGKDGEATYYVEFKANGESATVENTNQRVEPVNRIVEYGPRADDDEISTQVTRPIEFKTSVIYDDTLEEGKQVITQGELGEEVVTTTQKLVDGKPSGDPVTTTQQTKAPKNAVIRIGTKKPGAPDPAPEVSEVVELPFTTKIVYDPTLDPGQEVEDVAGENGKVKVTVVNGKATVETVKEPVQRVVRVGSKPQAAEWTEEKPFEVIVQEDPNMEAGTHRVKQQGQPKVIAHVGDDQKVISEGQPMIIVVGTKKPSTPPSKPSTPPSKPSTPPSKPSTPPSKPSTPPSKPSTPPSKPSTPPTSTTPNTTTPVTSTPITTTPASTPPTTTGGLTTAEKPSITPTPDAATVVERCVQNAVKSPLLYLIPLGLLGYGLNEVAGPVIQQAVAPYQDALNRINGELNARANEIARQYAPEDPFGVGRAGEELNRRLWENQDFARIANQVNDINAQAARLAAQYQPQLEMAGKAAGAILAVTAAGAVLYDWCSNDAGQAWTAVGTDKWSNLRNQQQ
ncbi:G5 domain-containing protein [Corynebacterium sp. TA-R-1]|uniref:G5 domain-containing protein n=1 Tax=Corynebacterium stercoris TaxID=2943490 RepID=A0ABT1G621_9CORY|nr:G5 domain-containing protein [Corynebacterium stercoris]MCP1388157.1 G5 domain-containing protein [Corynebacterium stercoris]